MPSRRSSTATGATHPLPPGERETLAYDLTSVLFFGVTCPLAELGYNAQDVEDQLQVNRAGP